jgi:hypothetical protein
MTLTGSKSMKLRSKHRQAGLTLTSLIFMLVLVSLVAIVAIRVVPTVTEYMAIKKAATNARAAGSTPREIRAAFDKQAEVNYIQSVSGKDLDISRTDAGAPEISFSYQKVIPLVGPASLLLDYEGTTGSNRKPKSTEH